MLRGATHLVEVSIQVVRVFHLEFSTALQCLLRQTASPFQDCQGLVGLQHTC